MTNTQRKARNRVHLRNLPREFQRKVRAIIADLEGWAWRPLIVESVRTREQQRRKVAAGVSRTMNSKHIRQRDGCAHAVDIACVGIYWNDTMPGFAPFRLMLGRSAETHNCRWGGRWHSYGPWGDFAHVEWRGPGT
jgi:hypothetical protein